MQIKCPQHKISMEIEECNLNVLGTVYPAIVGKCPACQVRHINRMIFSACGTYQIDGKSYQYSDELHALYPPKEPKQTKITTENKTAPKASSEKTLSKKEQKAKNKAEQQQKKKEKDAEKKKKAKEAGIKEMRERILSGSYKEYRVKKVHFVDKIPQFCTIDGDELLDVKHVSFEMYDTKVKAHAHCCIRCNSAYLLQKKQAEIQQLVGELQAKKKPQSKPATQPKQPPFTIAHVLNQIPVLETDKSQCPFCGKIFDSVVGVKYHVIDTTGQVIKKHANLQGCQHCKAVFADKQQIYSIRTENYKKKVHTISPLSYQNAKAMMDGTKLTPQQEEASKLPLPYEDMVNGVENISRESKVVQVYVNKCHCQKCENKYKRVTTVNRTAVVDTLDGSTANINVMFCKGCGQYFVSIVTLEQYKTIYGGILMECKVSHDFSPNQYSWFDFAPDSILSRCGYTVKEGVSRDYRQAILRYILETGKATKYEIIEKINSFISFRDNQPKYEGACQRWREDIKFVNEYMIHKQKKIYGLEFKAAKKH